jgi:hypothetical protein
MGTAPEESTLQVTCRACDATLAELLVPHLRTAALALGLDEVLSDLEICVDDLPAADTGWLRLDPVPGRDRPRLTIYCGRCALGPAPAGAAAFDWETVAVTAEADARPVDPAVATAFLHHQLLLARDLLRRDLDPDDIPATLAETFAAAWDVVLDGRLARAGLPCYGLAQRRAEFSRLFSSASVLMPHHWQIFQSLWEGGLEGQREVLAAVRQLPRL